MKNKIQTLKGWVESVNPTILTDKTKES